MPSTHDIAEKTAIIDALLAEYDRSNSAGKVWRFSETGYQGMEGYCRLKRVLSFHQVPAQIDLQTKLVFIRGHLTELMMEKVVRKIHPGFMLHPFDHAPLRYTHPDHGWTVQGRPDGLVWPNHVIEFKSINADAKLDKPHESHECQVMLTMYVLDRMLGSDQSRFSHGTIYYDKAGREFCVEPYQIESDGRMDRIIDELSWLHANFGDGYQLDPKEPLQINQRPEMLECRREKPDKFPCHWITRKGEGFCGYYHLCWGERPAPVRAAGPRRRRTTTRRAT